MSSSFDIFFYMLDKRVFEVIGPVGSGQLLRFCANYVATFQRGYIYNYTCFFIFSLIFFLTTTSLF